MQYNDPTLQELDLCNGYIGDRGAECLANDLATNSTLQVLFLDYDNIGDRGAECLANAFAFVTNSTLLEPDSYLQNNIGNQRTLLRGIISNK